MHKIRFFIGNSISQQFFYVCMYKVMAKHNDNNNNASIFTLTIFESNLTMFSVVQV